MDPLRHNCTHLYGRPYIYKDTVGFETILIFPHFLPPFRFPTDPSLSLLTQSRREESVGAGPLNRSIGLEENR
jgi:hypothetical protein